MATAFGVPVALGTVIAVEQGVSAALAPAHAEAAAAVRQAPARNADETRWRLGGRLCWLGVAVTTPAAFFVVHARRGALGLATLLGEALGGIVWLCPDGGGVPGVAAPGASLVGVRAGGGGGADGQRGGAGVAAGGAVAAAFVWQSG